ncbi:MAG: hypothetical protein JKX78_11830 [Alteromonadaceae bacterium]|nr:hypothetical protein [Alteromonadaceae bacterium]
MAPNKSVIANLVVFLTPIDLSSIAKATIFSPQVILQKIIKQKNKKFVPYIDVVQKGQIILFDNNDDITHHIYSVSGKNRFEFKIKGNKNKKSPILNSTGEVAMGCNIHDWMSGYVYVVDTPFFTKTNTNGKAIFNDMPTGQYQLSIWHPQLDVSNNTITQNITIGKQTSWQITLPKALLPIPKQESEDDFDFLEDY